MMRDWLDLARESVLNPRLGAARLMLMPLPDAALPLTLALLAVLNGIVYGLILSPVVVLSPVLLALISGAIIWLSAWLLTLVGARLGGHGQFPALLRMVLWLQAIRLVAQVALVLLSALVPPLAPMVGMAAGVWGLYMMVCFVTEAHGFPTRWKAVAALAAVFVLTLVLASLLVAMIGEPAGLAD
ncbi:MAG: YIP1 family protein [Rhodobacteraceae bacterium]|nr:YIP1 family protein [Paracoccaceae bacterium]MBR9822023.1 YIP1 family protein [Paracoccaceae bacterium]